MENELRKRGSASLKVQAQQSTNLFSREALWSRLKRGLETRARFVESHLSKNLAFQIRALRDREDWSQTQLAEKLGMNQNAISRLENPRYGKATITTLKRIAAAFDVALVVRFVPFGQLIDWVSGTPYVDRGLSTESLAVPRFEVENNRPPTHVEKQPVNAQITDNSAEIVSLLHQAPLGQSERFAHTKGRNTTCFCRTSSP